MARRNPRLTTIRGTRESVAVEREYQRRLRRLVDDMNRSVVYWIRAEYRRQYPKIATDALPSRALADKLEKVMKRWRAEFKDKADDIVAWFSNKVWRHVSNSLLQSLKTSGISLGPRRMTRTERDVLQRLIIENVSLIKTIPERYFEKVQRTVMNSVQAGGDLKTLSDELQRDYGLTRKRADLIARDQNAKATQQLSIAKNRALGITEGIWYHSSIAKQPRHSHQAMNGKKFNLAEGLYDSAVGHNVWPGSEINCRCFYKPVLPIAASNE